MKKIIRFSFASLILLVVPLFSQTMDVSKKVSIQFDFNRKHEFSTNQFAVWVQDTQGKMIQTLFVTQFTTGKGWLKKTTTLPSWRKAVKTSEIISIDGLSGATPEAGKMLLNWDFKDQKGIKVKEGTYLLMIEANLKKSDCVLFTSEITIGKTITIGAITERFSNEAHKNKPLISNIILQLVEK